MNDSLPIYRIIRSGRRSMVIEIKSSGEILVRIPRHVSDNKAHQFVLEHRDRVKLSLQKMQAIPIPPPLSSRQIYDLKQKAWEQLPKKAAHYAQLLQVVPRHIKITAAKTRFGSCSASKGICFSCLLMQYPQAAIEYVVLHEIAHIVHHNHSRQFYDLVEKYMPDFRQRSQMLKTVPHEDAL